MATDIRTVLVHISLFIALKWTANISECIKIFTITVFDNGREEKKYTLTWRLIKKAVERDEVHFD